jgi:hypothetical protein
MDRPTGPTIVEHTGERGALRPLFELAEDSAPALDAYIASGRVLVATGDGETLGHLRFYQRLGFRMRSIERDAFTEATGYPPGIVIDGIPLRDRVWLDRHVAQRPDTRSATRASRLGRGSSRADSRRSAER